MRVEDEAIRQGPAALDEHQVRRYPSGPRGSPCMLAHAFLAVVRANEQDRHPSPTS